MNSQLPRLLPTRYRVKSLLGQGGLGQVFHVRDELRGEELALKIVEGRSSDWLASEFELLRHISHENLVRVFDWGVLTTGGCFYTMEVIEGKDWSRDIGKPQTSDYVCRILGGVLRGLGHLHCHGKLHGDLKPSNILLGTRGEVKLADVGMPSTDEMSASQGGTIGYSAPEMWEGNPADARSDIYAVGVIAYEALSGQHPFHARTNRQVVAGQMSGWVPSLRTLGVEIESRLERCVMRALEREPALRYGTADEFLDDLGLPDRVGRIWSGLFVSRDKELSELDAALTDNVGINLVWITGAEGSGRQALAQEYCYRALRSDCRVLQLDPTVIDTSSELAGQIAAQVASQHDRTLDGTTNDAVRILEFAACPHRLVVTVDARRSTEHFTELIRSLAATVASHPSLRSRIRFVVSASRAPRLFSNEARIALQPFSEDGVGRLLSGLLGRVETDSGAISRLRALTGGIPGPTKNAILELASRGILARNNGVWAFRELTPIDTLTLDSLRGSISGIWTSLRREQKETLVYLTLLREGARTEVLCAASEANVPPGLDLLAQRGWIHCAEGRWLLTSEALRGELIKVAGPDVLRASAGMLLARVGSEVSDLDRAEISLLAGTIQEGISAALQGAEVATTRGLHLSASRLLRRAIALARDQTPRDELRRLSIALGNSLHVMGDHVGTVETLSDVTVWDENPSDQGLQAKRFHLLGLAYRARGDRDTAKQFLAEAVSHSEGAGDTSTWLRSSADMAQLDWELGSETERSTAIAQIRGILSDVENLPGYDDEKAALTYGLGAALIWAGSRAAASELLTKGLLLNCSDYWKMRMANALTSATMYLADYAASLQWSDRAWSLAEKAGANAFKARILGNRGATLHAMGRFRESAEVDMHSVEWARKVGNVYELEAGLSGAAINNLILARYETAVEQARSCRRLTERSGNEKHIAKAFELEGHAWFLLGDLVTARELVDHASMLVMNQEYVDTRPRLDWLKARILHELGDSYAAVRLLEAAESGLLTIGDVEDLLGVQAELNTIRGFIENGSEKVQNLCGIMNKAAAAGVLLPQLTAAVGIGELMGNALDEHSVELLRRNLAVAESAGVVEIAWQLNRLLGLQALHASASREAHQYFTRALRAIRQITEQLTSANRDRYLKSPRIRKGLDSIERASSSLRV